MKKTVILSAIVAAFSVNAQPAPDMNSVPDNSTIARQLAGNQMNNPNSRFNSASPIGTVNPGPMGNMTPPGVSITSAPSGSFLKIEDDRVIQQRSEQNRYMQGVLTEVGQNPEPSNSIHNKPLTGFAKDLSFVEVLKQIIPDGWNATAAKSVNINKPVSWTGGQNWVKTLEALAKENTLNLVVDWNYKTVRALPEDNLVAMNRAKEKIAKIDFSVPTPGMQNNMPGLPPGANIGPGQLPPGVTPAMIASGRVPGINPSMMPNMGAPIQPQAPNGAAFNASNNWLVKEGNLKQNLQEWANLSKFKLIYPDTVANYPIDDPFMLVGPLGGEDGVLSQLAGLFGEGSVKQPLEFELKTGGSSSVLIIRNKTYEQKFFKEVNEAK